MESKRRILDALMVLDKEIEKAVDNGLHLTEIGPLDVVDQVWQSNCSGHELDETDEYK